MPTATDLPSARTIRINYTTTPTERRQTREKYTALGMGRSAFIRKACREQGAIPPDLRRQLRELIGVIRLNADLSMIDRRGVAECVRAISEAGSDMAELIG